MYAPGEYIGKYVNIYAFKRVCKRCINSGMLIYLNVRVYTIWQYAFRSLNIDKFYIDILLHVLLNMVKY